MPLALRDVGYFLAVVKTGLLSSAAEACGVTQPTLTKAVQRVESEFGLQLFERTARGMTLTGAGRQIVEHVQRLQANYADAMLLADEVRAQHAGLLRLGVTDTTASSRIVPALATLLAQRPGLRVQMQIGRSDTLAMQVKQGELDVALVPVYEGQPVEGERTKVDSDPMVPMVRIGHPLAQTRQLTLHDLVPYGWILGSHKSAAFRVLSAIFGRYKLPPPRVVMEVPHASEMSLAILASTDLVTLVPAAFMRLTTDDRFAVLPIAALRIPRAVVLLTREGSTESPLVEALRETLLRRPR